MTTSRSGYASAIMPEILTADESKGKALPIGTEKGDQDGRRRLSPVEMGQAAYKVVSTGEAQTNMAARIRGDLAPIKGGIDDPNLPVEVKENLRMSKNKKTNKAAVVKASTTEEERAVRKSEPVNDETNFDPLGGEYAPGDAVLQAEERALDGNAAEPAERPLGSRNEVLAERVYKQAAPVSIHDIKQDNWFAQRGRATLTLTDGMFTMPVIDVKECPYGVTILLPLDPNNATFIPKPGSELVVDYKGRRWECFFPGTYFEIEELKLIGIVLVRKET